MEETRVIIMTVLAAYLLKVVSLGDPGTTNFTYKWLNIEFYRFKWHQWGFL
jgi:hypothetical protein